MNVVEIIKKKRDGGALSVAEIEYLIKNYVAGAIPDYQFSAFLMAGFLRGFNKRETAALTETMLYSGKVFDLTDIKGAKIDKHSTGGVGDKTSLILAPIAAAAGIIVPMISGRGLGHTGGTLDKLESIPGFSTNLNIREAKRVLLKNGFVMIGQTKEIAPADKLIYALRDVTATVESVPLITASIMSKKLAEGIDGLVLDVKTGSGAFMKSAKDAKLLANSLIATAKAFNKKAIAFITDMNQPLGNNIGNWLEVVESVKVLRGEIKNDLVELSLKLAGAMIFLGGKAESPEEGVRVAENKIRQGEAYEKFLEMVKLQGGDVSFIEEIEKYPVSKYYIKITSPGTGFVKKMDTLQIGMAALELGAGRLKKEDRIDPKAGIIIHKKIGDFLNKGDMLAEIFTDKKESVEKAKKRLLEAIEFSDKKVRKPKLIKQIIQ